MASDKLLTPKQAAKLFSDSLRKMGVSKKRPDIVKAWAVFKEFCAVPVARTTEGFIFHAGFKVDFPDGERVVDHSSYEVAFTRYWYEKGVVSDVAHLAECSFKIAGESGLHPHEWVDVEVDAGDGDAAIHTLKRVKFVQRVEMLTELWDLLRAASPTAMESYAGPQ